MSKTIATLTINGNVAARIRLKTSARLASVIGRTSESFKQDSPERAALLNFFYKVKNPCQYDSEFIMQEWEDAFRVLESCVQDTPNSTLEIR